MKTFMYMGMEYPKDSIYSEEMCKHMFAPDFSSFSKELWEETKQFGLDNNLSKEQMAKHLKDANENKPALNAGSSIDQFLSEKGK